MVRTRPQPPLWSPRLVARQLLRESPFGPDDDSLALVDFPSTRLQLTLELS